MPDRLHLLALAARFGAARPPRHRTPTAISVKRADHCVVLTASVESDWEEPWRSTWKSVLQHSQIEEPERAALVESLLEHHSEAGEIPVHALSYALAEVFGEWLARWQQMLPDWWRPAQGRPAEPAPGDREESTNIEDVSLGDALHGVEAPAIRDDLSALLRQLGAEGARLAEWNDEMPPGTFFLPASDAPVVSLGIMDVEPRPIRVAGPDPFTCAPMRRVALALWRDRIQPARERRLRLGVLPVLITSALFGGPCGEVELSSTDDASISLLRRSRGGGGIAELRTTGLHQGAMMDAEAVRALVERGVKELDTVRPLRFIPWLVASIQQREREEIPLIVEGGGAGLAAQIGEDPDRYGTSYRAIAHLMSRLYLHISTGVYQLYSLSEERQTRNRPARLIFIPGLVLLSGRIRGTFPQGDSRSLVPLPLDLPPLGGSPNSLAARGRFWWAILVELRRQADDLASGDGVHLPMQTLASLAQKVELPPNQILPTIQALTDAGAITCVRTDRYDLGSRYPTHRQMLVESGRLVTGGRDAGKASVSRRHKRLITHD